MIMRVKKSKYRRKLLSAPGDYTISYKQDNF